MNKPRVKEEKLRTHIVLRKDQREQLANIAESHGRGVSSIVRDLLDVALPNAIKSADAMLRNRFAQDDLALALRNARQEGDERKVNALLDQV